MSQLTDIKCPYCGCVNYNGYHGIDREVLALTGAACIECPDCEALYSIDESEVNNECLIRY